MAAVNSILQVENLTKSFGDLVLFENISFGLSEGQRVGLIAKNGSGKSTLLNILSGKEGYDGGTISFRRDIRVGYLEQDPPAPQIRLIIRLLQDLHPEIHPKIKSDSLIIILYIKHYLQVLNNLTIMMPCGILLYFLLFCLFLSNKYVTLKYHFGLDWN